VPRIQSVTKSLVVTLQLNLCTLQNQRLTFRGPCIVMYSYNKSQRNALFLKFILIKNSTCFGQIYCPSSGVSTLYTQQQVFVMLVDCMLARWPRKQTVNITSMTNVYCCVYSVETPDDGQYVCPKRVHFFIKINLRISESRWLLLLEENQ